MTYLESLKTAKGKDRLHDRLNTLLVAVSSIAMASALIVDGRVDFSNKEQFMAAASIRFPLELRMPLLGPLEAAIESKYPDAIDLALTPTSENVPEHKVWTSGLDAVISYLVTAAFIEFYESHRDWISSKFGQPDQWPEVLNFARVIRNALGHGGAIHFQNANSKPVTWYGLSYGPADNGKKVLYNGLSFADFFILMFECSDELDKAGCPVM